MKSSVRRLYRLSGVLLHLGRQSTSGHYIAVVRENQPTSCLYDPAVQAEGSTNDDADTAAGSCDLTQDCWKICNDEQSLGGNVTATTTAQPVDTLPSNFHTSTTAYMIFYRRIAEQDESGQGPVDCVPVPEHLEAITKCKTAAYLEDLATKRAEQVAYKKLLFERSTLRAEILSRLSLKPSPVAEIAIPAEKRRRRDEQITTTTASPCPVSSNAASSSSLEGQVSLTDVCLVPTQWLSDWLREPEKCPPQLLLPDHQPVFVMSPTESGQTRSHSLTLCPHGHVPPDTAPSTLRAVSLDGLRSCLASIDNDRDTSRYVCSFQAI
ncbi:unnamed protein product [Dibothriocephalus latus]|uniref:USP domain-containing protein n=1 Tax=Dibothriocephalus latus TaxID=60516 RepID=A0A3P7LFV4_DIBLA|nr:unnamed protein product [Dibothriocephalus latus]